MGRHSASGPDASARSPARQRDSRLALHGADLLGWGLFTAALTTVVLAWLGVDWVVVGGVAAAVVLGIGVVWLALAAGAGRGSGRASPPSPSAGHGDGEDRD